MFLVNSKVGVFMKNRQPCFWPVLLSDVCCINTYKQKYWQFFTLVGSAVSEDFFSSSQNKATGCSLFWKKSGTCGHCYEVLWYGACMNSDWNLHNAPAPCSSAWGSTCQWLKHVGIFSHLFWAITEVIFGLCSFSVTSSQGSPSFH